MKNLIKSISLAAILSVGLAGCKTVTTPTPPLIGQVSTFDGQSFLALEAVSASLNSLKSSVQTDPNLIALKPALNQAITDYDAAEVLWQTYHAAAVVNAATAAQQTTLQTAITKVQTDVTALQTTTK